MKSLYKIIDVGVVAHSGMEAHRSIDPPDNYLFGFSVRLGT